MRRISLGAEACTPFHAPGRFPAVFGISLPFIQLGGARYFDRLRAAGGPAPIICHLRDPSRPHA